MPFIPAIGVALGATAGTAGATALGTLAVIGTAAGVAGVVTSITGAKQQRKAVKSATRTQDLAAQEAIKSQKAIETGRQLEEAEEVKKAEQAAAGVATETKKKATLRRRRTKTILTSPLGAGQPTETFAKTLLGS